MRVLFIGGTGLISSACAAEAVRRGMELTLLTRGSGDAHYPPPSGVGRITGDIRKDPAGVARALGNERFDAVVDWVAYTLPHIETDIALFARRTRQFVFISSASAYQKPPVHFVYREDTPLANPFWEYARNKIACEERLIRAFREEGVPVTIVRPSHTYGPGKVPASLTSRGGYTHLARMRRGAPVIVHGDGTSLWTLTWNGDFARAFISLLGHPQAIGQAVHITSDEALNWNQIHALLAQALGVDPRLVHIATDTLCARQPDWTGPLWGDKAWCAVFDNSKIKRLVPDYVATMSFAEGVRRAVAWFDERPERQTVDADAERLWDELITAHAGKGRPL